MNEKEAKAVFLSFLEKNNFEYLIEKRFPHTQPDIVFKKENFWYCVEVKGEDSDLTNALGEIVKYYMDFSHVCVCAPIIFIEALLEIIANNPELKFLAKKLGIYMIDGDRILVFQHPRNNVYYCPDMKRDYRIKRKVKNYFLPDEIDLRILELASQGPVFSSDARKFGLKQAVFHKRLLNLEKKGYLQRAVKGMNPVPFVRTEKQLSIFKF